MIVVVAPFPRPETVRDGWRSRMAAVDRLFDDERRAYVEFVDDGRTTPPDAEPVSDLVDVYRLNIRLAAHYERLRNLVLGAEMVYVHTVHLARYVLPFYRTGKVVTDIHGAAPEEERLYGQHEAARFYDEVERTVLTESRHAVAVSHALVSHLRGKYPKSPTEFTVLPVFEPRHPRPDGDLGPRSRTGRPRVIYSGALQRWQNVDLMMDLARERLGALDFVFLSDAPDTCETLARQRGIDRLVSVRSARKEELAGFYRQADYGLVLRDDDVVNRVACPTKLSEYLWFGVIPVVKFPGLGDFPGLGYRYVTLEDFRAGKLPGADEQREMRGRNFEVIEALRAAFEDGAHAVRELKHRLPKGDERPVGFLSDFERNVVFPAYSELTVEAPRAASEPPRVLRADFAEPYHAVEFDLGAEAPVHCLTWMPIDRECQLVLRAVTITDGSGRPIAHRMSGDYAAGPGGLLTFRARYPRLRFDLGGDRWPRRFVARFDILLVGDEVFAARARAARPLGATLRQRIRATLRSYPAVRRAYERFVKPLRRGRRYAR